jgi:hypothetical protein
MQKINKTIKSKTPKSKITKSKTTEIETPPKKKLTLRENTELHDIILKRIAKGESLNSICKEAGMPSISAFVELTQEDEILGEKYVRARDTQAEVLFDEIMDIIERTPAKGEDVAKARLLVDTKKWFLSKVKPRRFGDKVDVTTLGEAIKTGIIVQSDTQAEKVNDLLSQFDDE